METKNLTKPMPRDMKENYDFEVRSLDVAYLHPPAPANPLRQNLRYALAGLLFGILMIKSEVASWFRIQEMFRLQSFQMYGIMGSALATGMLSVWLIKRFQLKTIHGEPVVLPRKKFNKGQVFGGLLFGAGWAITGACPGPLFALVGAGVTAMIVTLLSAIAGTWVYGWLREKLPH